MKATIKHFLSIGMIKKNYVADALIAILDLYQKAHPRGKLMIVKTSEATVKAFERLKLIDPGAGNALVEEMGVL